MSKCSEFSDYRKCDLVIDLINASFGSFADRVAKQAPQLHHRIEIGARCIACDKTYWFTKDDLKIEDFGQIWRTAVFSKPYKP